MPPIATHAFVGTALGRLVAVGLTSLVLERRRADGRARAGGASRSP